jgi:hypothetical protein
VGAHDGLSVSVEQTADSLTYSLGPRGQPVRRVRVGPDGRTLAATFGERSRVAEAAWWDLVGGRFLGRSAVFPPGWGDGCYTDEFAEPAFTPDLARCVAHGYSPGSGSAEFHYLVAVEPGRDYPDGVGLGFPGEYYDQPEFEAFAVSPDGRWVFTGQGGDCFTEKRRGWFCRRDLRKVEFGPEGTSPADPEDEEQEEGDSEPGVWEEGEVALVPEAEGDMADTGPWKVIDTTGGKTNDFGSYSYPDGSALFRTRSSGDLFLNHS